MNSPTSFETSVPSAPASIRAYSTASRAAISTRSSTACQTRARLPSTLITSLPRLLMHSALNYPQQAGEDAACSCASRQDHLLAARDEVSGKQDKSKDREKQTSDQ